MSGRMGMSVRCVLCFRFWHADLTLSYTLTTSSLNWNNHKNLRNNSQIQSLHNLVQLPNSIHLYYKHNLNSEYCIKLPGEGRRRQGTESHHIPSHCVNCGGRTRRESQTVGLVCPANKAHPLAAPLALAGLQAAATKHSNTLLKVEGYMEECFFSSLRSTKIQVKLVSFSGGTFTADILWKINFSHYQS